MRLTQGGQAVDLPSSSLAESQANLPLVIGRTHRKGVDYGR